MTNENENQDIKNMDFETALKELETIIQNLETGQTKLETAIKLYERGEMLKEKCENILKNAEEKINQIVLSKEGKPEKMKPFEEN